ncbi:DUF2599 domain-containing protein [Nocardia callitridis]|uniref:DUF2599 domain-containing protein n=1 Tax=Nocardia callitridis TaxID=648753 RepID=A0ABP9K1X9_9NOCA
MAQRYPDRLASSYRAKWPRIIGAVLAVAACATGCATEAADTAEPASATVPAHETPSRTTPSTTAARTTAPELGTQTPPVAPAPPAVDPFEGMALIDHTAWTDAVDGPRLLVFPTQAGRDTTFPDSVHRAWQEVVDDSTTVDADTPGMYDQFLCHWQWARVVKPNKPSWNLEPWRPAVGYQETVNALCNPGGPER